MNKVLIVDNRAAYYQNIKTRIEISDELELDAEIFLYTDYSEFQEHITKNHYDMIAVVSGVIMSDDFVIPAEQKLFGYLERKNFDNSIFDNSGIVDLGYFNDSFEMLKTLEKMQPNDAEIKNETKNETPVTTLSVENTNTETTIKPDTEEVRGIRSETKAENAAEKAFFCSNCGTKLLPETRFCHICGTPVDDADAMIRNAAIDRDDRTDDIEKLVAEDLKLQRHQCKVVSSYAAKGGVGKTTIAANLAVLLARTTTDRRKTRVCIVDFNIDFGNIRTTLNFSRKDVTMIDWLANIDAKIGEGIDPKEIKYSKEEIECFLQKKSFKKTLSNDETEIYGLIAPLIHKDSMGIPEKSFEVMLRNLKENGDFDYIICDTGNNTRDSSFTALELSDKILLIATQDVTTVDCNDSFLKTMDEISDFDKGKVYLVINNIISAKETGVSVKDIEEAVPEFPCIGRIRRNTSVTLANNKGIPAALDSGAPFTRELSEIVSAIIDEDLEIKPKKKGIFSFLRK